MVSLQSLKRMAWRERNRDRDLSSLRRFYARHREKLLVLAKLRYQRDRNKRIQQAIAWNKANPEKRSKIMVFQNAKRRSRIKANGGRGFNKSDWEELLRRTGGMCVYCRQSRATSIDHHVPLSLGGQHDWFNIVPACKSCNSRKGSKHPWEWIPKAFGLQRWNEVEASKLNFMRRVLETAQCSSQS